MKNSSVALLVVKKQQKKNRVFLNLCQPKRQTTENDDKDMPSSQNIALRDWKMTSSSSSLCHIMQSAAEFPGRGYQ